MKYFKIHHSAFLIQIKRSEMLNFGGLMMNIEVRMMNDEV